MIDLNTLTVGTDAEAPLLLVTGDAIPATGIIPGTKAKPVPIKKLGEGFTIQQDNVNLEFNVPPARTAKEFNNFIGKAVAAINAGLPPIITVGWRKGSMIYKKEFLQHEAVTTFGCDPDFNVYEGEENPRPRSKNPCLRTAAAHVHVGWANPNNDQREALVKLLDFFLALPLVEHDDPVRKEMYGLAGTFRPKEYGVEYRTLGNFWVPDYASYVFESVVKAVQAFNRGYVVPEELIKDLRKTIDTCGTPTRGLLHEMRNQEIWVY